MLSIIDFAVQKLHEILKKAMQKIVWRFTVKLR